MALGKSFALPCLGGSKQGSGQRAAGQQDSRRGSWMLLWVLWVLL